MSSLMCSNENVKFFMIILGVPVLILTVFIIFTGAGISATKGSPAKSGWSGGGMLKFSVHFVFCILYFVFWYAKI